jgi:hypothetical protein
MTLTKHIAMRWKEPVIPPPRYSGGGGGHSFHTLKSYWIKNIIKKILKITFLLATPVRIFKIFKIIRHNFLSYIPKKEWLFWPPCREYLLGLKNMQHFVTFKEFIEFYIYIYIYIQYTINTIGTSGYIYLVVMSLSVLFCHVVILL